MNIEQKVKAVEEIFFELDRDISAFQEESGIRCKQRCIECCLKPDIEASILEFLPLAWWMSEAGIDLFEYWLKIAESPTASNHCCIFLDKQKKRCRVYKKRGLICRLFGFSFILDKNHKPQLIACRYLKERFQFHLSSSLSKLPVASHYSMRLIAVDPYLANQKYQINVAIYKAFQLVAMYLYYNKSMCG